jgi:5-dehydro-2-deoxygluconokinase
LVIVAPQPDVFDLITMGRVGVDLYPLQSGVGLEKVESFGKFLGGSPTNVAVAGAKYGLTTAVVTKTGDDPLGRFIVQELDRLGVTTDFVSTTSEVNTPIVLCEIFPPDNFPLYFYRDPVAPDLLLEASELDFEAIENAAVFWVTTTGFSREPSRQAHHQALRQRGRKHHTILDLDYRATLWANPEEATAEVGRALEYSSVAIGNKEECQIAVGETDPHRAADALLERGVDIAVVKQGPKGVLAKTADEVVEVAPFPVDVVNGLGAGDAFGGAFVFGLLQGWDLEKIVGFANVAGALVAGRLECATAMPDRAEVDTAWAGSTA